jgi:hypothetical protein
MPVVKRFKYKVFVTMIRMQKYSRYRLSLNMEKLKPDEQPLS